MRGVTSHTAGRHGLAAILALLCLAGPAGRRAGATLTRYETKYYTIYTDIDPEPEREAAVRMTHMAEEYHDRTKAFAGVIRHRFPFYLYKSPADYYAAGGLRGTAGVYIGSSDGTGKLMAIAGERITPYTWHTVQHEGFHQFAHAVIGGDIPTWLNEGLAEYFGEAIYTGDGFVTGVVPPWRLVRLKKEIEDGQLKTVGALMEVSPEQWRAEMSIRNYDQAWSMVHFLVHADDGRYAPAFSQCIREIAAHQPFETAWRGTIGPADGFEERWKAYWTAQPRSPTHELYARATVATLTSFLARAVAERQPVPDLATFVHAADADTLKVNPADWLPRSLLTDALQAGQLDQAVAGDDAAASADVAPDDATAPKPAHWELKAGRQPTLTATVADGTRLTGWFTLNGNRIAAVNVETDDTSKVLAEAKALLDGGHKSQDRVRVQSALRQNPRSPSAAAARAFLRTCQ